ncbi:MAG: KH domain-containing protein [Corallococcus sp.]|nr:KH domain-containing protein [Bacillota bacterium]MCM1533193.1 KH domain-containing protein [Corallococcus sp.]
MMRKSKKNDEISEVAESVAEEQTETASDEANKVKEFLENILSKMELDGCAVEMKTDGDTVKLNVIGDNASHAIGYRGETLDALQYLCNLILSGTRGNYKRVTLDAEGYRSKREKSLQRLASNLEQKVKRTGRSVKLEPMNPYERRIIHTSLQGSKYVTTQSEGEGLSRHVVVLPLQQSDILNAPNAPRKTLNFVYRSEKKRRR